MHKRKDMGELSELKIIAPQATGRRAVVHMQVDVLVEVQENDSWNDMEEQAKDELRKRIRDAKGFLPFRMRADMIHDGATVEQLQQRLTVHPRRGW